MEWSQMSPAERDALVWEYFPDTVLIDHTTGAPVSPSTNRDAIALIEAEIERRGMTCYYLEKISGYLGLSTASLKQHGIDRISPSARAVCALRAIGRVVPS